MEAIHIVFEPAKVEEGLAHYGYKPTPERVEKVLQTIAGTAWTDVEQIIEDTIEYLEENDGEFGERDL